MDSPAGHAPRQVFRKEPLPQGLTAIHRGSGAEPRVPQWLIVSSSNANEPLYFRGFCLFAPCLAFGQVSIVAYPADHAIPSKDHQRDFLKGEHFAKVRQSKVQHWPKGQQVNAGVHWECDQNSINIVKLTGQAYNVKELYFYWCR